MAAATSAPSGEGIRNHAAFIWSVADLLRGDYKRSEYGKVILPLTVIRRLDCVLEPTKQAVLEKHKQLASKIENVEPVLQAVSGEQFFNTSPLTFTKLLDDPNTIADSLHLYIGGFSEAANLSRFTEAAKRRSDALSKRAADLRSEAQEIKDAVIAATAAAEATRV